MRRRVGWSQGRHCLLLLGVMLAGCARLASRDDAFETVAEATAARLHQALAWTRAPAVSDAPVGAYGRHSDACAGVAHCAARQP